MQFILFSLFHIKNYHFLQESDTDQWSVVHWFYPIPHQGW